MTKLTRKEYMKKVVKINVQKMGRLSRIRFHKSNLTPKDRNTWARYIEY